MKKLFYFGLTGLALFEILHVYFIMPFPGSQRMNSIDLAYFLHTWRWVFRILFTLMVIIGSILAFQIKKKWLPAMVLLLAMIIVYFFNFRMTADKMFLQPKNVEFKARPDNQLLGSRLVIGVENNGEAKAYPIEYLTYHHQIHDNIGGKPVMVTYCSVCRTGRVYEPIVKGQKEKFRLVGMDHFNAMFEDASTKSWWRQSTGEAIAGKLKGSVLPEIESHQMTIDKWFEMYPQGLVMQPDESFSAMYDTLAKYEQGLSEAALTRTDSLPWFDKSWVVGIQLDTHFKAYDWINLKSEKLIHDSIGQIPIVLALSSDGHSFVAFERPAGLHFTMRNDTLFADSIAYDFSGQALDSSSHKLKSIQAYQEFWHSWRTFHPTTKR